MVQQPRQIDGWRDENENVEEKKKSLHMQKYFKAKSGKCEYKQSFHSKTSNATGIGINVSEYDSK